MSRDGRDSYEQPWLLPIDHAVPQYLRDESRRSDEVENQNQNLRSKK